jgi:hypothetical protein
MRERNMIMRDQTNGLAHVRQIDEGAIGVRRPFARTVDPLKIVDGLPKKRVVSHDDPDGLPGHGRYGGAY